MHIKSDSPFAVEHFPEKMILQFECGCRSSFYHDFVKANETKLKEIELHIGRCTYIEDHCELRYYSCATSEYRFQVGNYTSIGNHTSFIMNGGHRTDHLSTHKFFRYFELPSKEWECVNKLKNLGITIGSDVWIGAHSVIQSGANIPDGVVLGTNTLVLSDEKLEPFDIYAGSPAKLIRFRFNKEIIQKLLHLKWWDKPLIWVEKHKKFFDFDLNKDPLKSLKLLDSLIHNTQKEENATDK